ncbi:MAG: hypothetical protein HYU56_01210 [Candidatus Aenigmarchaeota archaeon]|nr:hypothetical protein [Candidatus Aenigmarchaeota archaeon]
MKHNVSGITSSHKPPTLVGGILRRYDIEEIREGSLESALSAYFAVAGTPDFVESGSDFVAVENALGRYGKSLRRRFLGFLSGRYTVDAPARVASEA